MEHSPSPDFAILSQTERGRRLAILIAVAGIDLMGAAMIFPLIPFYALHLKIPPVMIGVIMASFWVAQMVSAPLWGRISDRYGRRPALLIGLGSLGAGYCIFAFADSMWLLLLSRAIQGAGGGTTAVTQAYVADTVAPQDRARSLGWLSAGTNVGTMLGPVIGSWAAYRGQYLPGVLAASLCLMNLLFAWKWLPESRRRAEPKGAPKKPVWHGAWIVLRHPGGAAQRLILLYAVGMFGMSCMQSVLGLYLGAAFGITETTVGYFYLYVGVFSVLMRSALIGPIVDQLGELWTLRAGAVCLAAGLLSYPFAPNLWLLAAVIPLIPIGAALLFPATTALLSKTSDGGELGATLGVAQTFAGLSRLIAPVTATLLFQYLGRQAPFLFASAMVAVLAAVLASQLQESPRRAAVRV